MKVLAYSSIAAALIGVAAAGQAHIHNQCSKNVYLWSVDTEHNQGSPTVVAPGGSYSESYRKPKVGGVSIKMSFDKVLKDPITQFEYTKGGEMDGFIWYDVSNVNCYGAGCPFEPYGFNFHSGPGCPAVTCAAGDASCAGVYNVWNDDHASLACDDSQDIVLYLCSGSSGPSEPSESPSSSYSSSASSTATSTSTATYTKPSSTFNIAPSPTSYQSSSASSSASPSPSSYDGDEYIEAAVNKEVPSPEKKGNKNVVVVTVTHYSTVHTYVEPTPTPYAHRRHRRHGVA